jgi:hypothetical protein
MADGRHSRSIRLAPNRSIWWAARRLQRRARWSNSPLVIESVLKTPARTFPFKDQWSLSADGQTLRMVHLEDDLAGQVAVLDKNGA